MLTFPQLAPLTTAPDFVLTVTAGARERPEVLFTELATRLHERDGTVVALFVYGDVAAREQTTRAMRRALGPIDWPVLWVEGRSCNGALVAGVQAFAVHGVEVERVLVHGRIVGTTYADGQYRHCFLAGVAPDDLAASRPEQARSLFENVQAALGWSGFEFRDIARTWFYNDQLLDWYGEFNAVRTAFYAAQPFRSGSAPASTGVEARNPLGAALAFAAWAVRPVDEVASAAARVVEVPSPLQCPAPHYGSAFSRAMEIESAGVRRLLISGTASIAPDGRTVWRGDIEKQIATTMDVVEAILASRRLGYDAVIRATAYFKFPLDAGALVAWQRRNRVTLPAVFVHCDICRDDLLFEIELDAVG